MLTTGYTSKTEAAPSVNLCICQSADKEFRWFRTRTDGNTPLNEADQVVAENKNSRRVLNVTKVTYFYNLHTSSIGVVIAHLPSKQMARV